VQAAHGAEEPEEESVLLGWETAGLEGYGPSPWEAPSFVATGLRLEGGLLRGPGLDTGGTAAADIWGGRGFAASTREDAIAQGQFISFMIAPEEGFSFSLTGIEQNFRRSGTGPEFFQWQAQIGEATEFINLGSSWSYTGTATEGEAQPSIALSHMPELQSIDEAVGLRLILWGGASTGTWGFGRLSGPDLVFTGAVIPEPSVYAAVFGGSTLLAAWLLRRRRTGGIRKAK